MAATKFRCPDNETIEINRCLEVGGCRMPERCATVPYLRLIGFDREWKGVSPSSAGNGPRLLYLKATRDYTIDPQDRVWAAFGTSTHEKLSIHAYTHNVLAEEKLSDDKMAGIADCLEIDESMLSCFILTDYKSWGSYKVAKALGLSVEKKDVPILGENGDPILLKSGPNKGKPKTKQESKFVYGKPDLKAEELQLNRYRIFFNNYGFKINKIQIQVIGRDGGTYIAKSRGIDRNLYIIPVKKLPDDEVLAFYDTLSGEVDEAFKAGYVRKCNEWEGWEGRRCEGFCEVSEHCALMGK